MTVIYDPSLITLNPETWNLIEEVSAAAEQINSLKPFDEEVNHRITREFLPDRVTASLNIEGIAVTRRQTLLMMDAMTLSASGSKEERELLNALKADEFVYDLAKGDENISASSIRGINGLILDGVVDGAGGFRDKDVQISGAKFQPPEFISVPPLFSEMIEIFNHTMGLHAVIRAAWLHGTFTKIHPFIDGNGRTGRLIQDFVLMKGGLYPTGIPSSMRDSYYDALEQADNGNWDNLCQMICRVELNLISRVQAIVDEVKSRGHFVSLLAAKAKEKKVGTLHKQYVVWRQRMENLLNLMEKTCDEVNAASDVIQIQTENYEIIDFDKWKELSDKGRASNTWAAKQNWLIDGVSLYRTILFFRRHDFRPDDVFTRDDLHGKVALKVTGGEVIPGAKYNFETFDDPTIRFREIMWIDGRLQLLTFSGERRKGKKQAEEVWQTEELTESSVAIQGLIEDIFMKKLGLGS
jgi:Fic family protein